MAFGKIEYTRTSVSANTHTTTPFKSAKRIHWIHIDYTANATVGNRQIVIQQLDGGDNIAIDLHAGGVQAASANYHYSCIPGIFRETSFVDDSIQVPLPMNMILPANHKLKVIDTTGVSSSDSFVITYLTEDV